jgi:hypothetical protein
MQVAKNQYAMRCDSYFMDTSARGRVQRPEVVTTSVICSSERAAAASRCRARTDSGRAASGRGTPASKRSATPSSAGPTEPPRPSIEWHATQI